MSYHGDIRLGDTIDIQFTTNSSGTPTTLAGTPAVSAYIGNSITEITAGITLTVDLDARTGLHNVRVVATSGNGYAAATNVSLVITAGTVGGVSAVGYKVGSFSIENRSHLMPTTAGRTLDVSATGEAGLDWANIGSPTTAVNLSATNIDVDQVVASVSGAVGSVTGAVGSVTGAVGSVTGAVGSVTGAVGSVTGNVGGNVVGSVGSVTAQVTANVTAISGDTTAADLLEALMDGAVLVAVNGVATTTSIPIDGFTSVRNDQFNGRLITVLDGSYEQTDITDYVHATQTLTVTALSAAPGDNVFLIIQ